MSQPTLLDPRLTAARPDLASSKLCGQVEAERFVDGVRYTVATETVDLKRKPRHDAAVDTQVLYGQTLVVYEEEEGWGWAQSDEDGYVGYVGMSNLNSEAVEATHRVIVNRTFVYPAADMKQPILASVPLDGRVVVEDLPGGFAKLRGRGFIVARHVAPLKDAARDYVAVAEQLIGCPYLWGGKSAQGIDCSGLVQLAMSVAGNSMPRDTDLQEEIGEALPFSESPAGLARGDRVFWKGHVGIMVDDQTLLHANAHHMLVVREPLRDAAARIFAMTGLPISSVRRATT